MKVKLIDLIENDSYFEVGGWGDGQSNDGSYLDGNIKKVIINSNKYKTDIMLKITTQINLTIFFIDLIINNT